MELLSKSETGSVSSNLFKVSEGCLLALLTG